MSDFDPNELDPIAFWVLLLLSGGQQFTFHDLVKTMDRSKESVWEALQTLQSKKYAKNASSKFMIDFTGVEYLTKRGVLASEAEEEPKRKDFEKKIKPPFFSSWAEMFIWLGFPFLLILVALIINWWIVRGYNYISPEKVMYQYAVSIVCGVLIIVYIWFSKHYILEHERLVVFQGGKVIGKKGPGLVLLLPLIHNPKKVDLRENSIEIKREPCITRDNILMTAGFYVIWQIDDPILSITKVSDVKDSMTLLSTAVLRAAIAEFSMDEALDKRRALNTLICARIARKASDWGVEIKTTEIRELQPSDGMMRQIENRFSAALESEAAMTMSDAKVRSLRDFLTIGEGMARNPLAFNLKYLDTLEKIGEGASTKYIIPMEFFNVLRDWMQTQGNGNNPGNVNNPPEQLPPGGPIQ